MTLLTGGMADTVLADLSVRAHWHPEGRLTQGTLVARAERRDVLESDKIWLRALLSCC